MKDPRLLLYAALLLALLDLMHKVDPPQQMPLVQADYQRCVTVKPGPIQRPDHYTTQPYRKKESVA